MIGRPRSDLVLDDVEFLLSLSLSMTKVAQILMVSRSTIYRCMKEENRVLGSYTSITDATLDTIIQSIKRHDQNDGEVMVAAHLSRIGVRVTWARMRASIHRVDPLGVAERSCQIIRCRTYSAPHPNYVWHMDSHHKLIRWRIVIHGAVDGFSRKVLYLTCANNNRASTVVSLFSSAADSHGLPER